MLLGPASRLRGVGGRTGVRRGGGRRDEEHRDCGRDEVSAHTWVLPREDARAGLTMSETQFAAAGWRNTRSQPRPIPRLSGRGHSSDVLLAHAAGHGDRPRSTPCTCATPALLAFARHMLGRRHDAEDVVQHTFLAADRAFRAGKVPGPSAPGSTRSPATAASRSCARVATRSRSPGTSACRPTASPPRSSSGKSSARWPPTCAGCLTTSARRCCWRSSASSHTSRWRG